MHWRLQEADSSGVDVIFTSLSLTLRISPTRRRVQENISYNNRSKYFNGLFTSKGWAREIQFKPVWHHVCINWDLLADIGPTDVPADRNKLTAYLLCKQDMDHLTSMLAHRPESEMRYLR